MKKYLTLAIALVSTTALLGVAEPAEAKHHGWRRCGGGGNFNRGWGMGGCRGGKGWGNHRGWRNGRGWGNGRGCGPRTSYFRDMFCFY